MRFWADQASHPFQSHDLWFLSEDIRWGKYEAGYDTKALIGSQPRGPLEGGRQGAMLPLPIFRFDSRGKETFFDGRCSIRKIRPRI